MSDAHGGEYYRPLPMLVWWLLGRPGLGSAPFAALALGLHAGAAALTGLLLRALGRPVAVAYGAAVLMLLAPQNLDAAYWFSASTDLLATVFVLGSLIAIVRGRLSLAAALALAAYLSKESAYALPLLALLVLRGLPWRRRLAAIAPQLALLAAVLVVRVRVLHGWGGAGDARAGLGAKLFQIASGLAHVFTGDGVMPEVLAFGVGTAIVALAGVRRDPAAEGRGGAGLLPLAFCALAAGAAARGGLGGRRALLLSAGGRAGLGGGGGAGVRRDRGARRDRLRRR